MNEFDRALQHITEGVGSGESEAKPKKQYRDPSQPAASPVPRSEENTTDAAPRAGRPEAMGERKPRNAVEDAVQRMRDGRLVAMAEIIEDYGEEKFFAEVDIDLVRQIRNMLEDVRYLKKNYAARNESKVQEIHDRDEAELDKLSKLKHPTAQQQARINVLVKRKNLPDSKPWVTKVQEVEDRTEFSGRSHGTYKATDAEVDRHEREAHAHDEIRHKSEPHQVTLPKTLSIFLSDEDHRFHLIGSIMKGDEDLFKRSQDGFNDYQDALTAMEDAGYTQFNKPATIDGGGRVPPEEMTEDVNEEAPDYNKMFKTVDRTMDASAYRKMDRARAEKLLAQEGGLETDGAKQILHELWRDEGAVVARAVIRKFKQDK